MRTKVDVACMRSSLRHDCLPSKRSKSNSEACEYTDVCSDRIPDQRIVRETRVKIHAFAGYEQHGGMTLARSL